MLQGITNFVNFPEARVVGISNVSSSCKEFCGLTNAILDGYQPRNLRRDIARSLRRAVVRIERHC